MTNTNAQCPNPPDGGFSAEDAEALPHSVNPLGTRTKSNCQIQNTATTRSVHNWALSQQTHRKGCRHPDSFITSNLPLLFLHLHHTSFPTHIQSMYQRSKMTQEAAHHTTVLCLISHTRYPQISVDMFGLEHLKQGTVQRGVSACRGTGAKFTAASTCLGEKKANKWLLLHFVAPRSMQVTQNVGKSMAKAKALLVLLLKHLLAKS